MPILKDDVKNALGVWLESKGFSNVKIRLGTKQGYDVEGVNPTSCKRLVIECKGEAKTGDQWPRSWHNVSSAILTSLWETENSENLNDVAMAFPDTKDYRNRMSRLQAFCKRQCIAVYWVSEDGKVQQW
ncbi:MAG: hypothetical protein WCH01_23325 [Methylococcaceae bacterium]